MLNPDGVPDRTRMPDTPDLLLFVVSILDSFLELLKDLDCPVRLSPRELKNDHLREELKWSLRRLRVVLSWDYVGLHRVCVVSIIHIILRLLLEVVEVFNIFRRVSKYILLDCLDHRSFSHNNSFQLSFETGCGHPRCGSAKGRKAKPQRGRPNREDGGSGKKKQVQYNDTSFLFINKD